MQSIEVYADGVEDEAHLLYRALGDRSDEGCVHRFKGSFESAHDSPEYRFSSSRRSCCSDPQRGRGERLARVAAAKVWRR
jgi:hypothetical protein